VPINDFLDEIGKDKNVEKYKEMFAENWIFTVGDV